MTQVIAFILNDKNILYKTSNKIIIKIFKKAL